jgi:hypothetical protein
MLLEGVTVSELNICCVQTRHMVSFGRHLGDGNMTLRIVRAKREDGRVDGGERVYHSTLDGGDKKTNWKDTTVKTAETPNFVSSAKYSPQSGSRPTDKWQRSLLIQSPKREHRPSSCYSISTGPTTFQKYMGDVIEFCHKASETVIQAGKPRS